MLRITLWLLVGVFVWDFVSCSVICPDGGKCPDGTTCCFHGEGYKCCPFNNAVCCPDLTHCCPAGFRCNMVSMKCEKSNQPWLSIPLVKKEAAERPNPSVLPGSALSGPKNPDEGNVLIEQPWSKPMTSLTVAGPSTNIDRVVYCDSEFHCSAGTTCCKGATGEWGCCPHPLGQCCADGKHCCKSGYNCDALSMTCIRFYTQVPSEAREEAKTD